jgi:hypothetical protein
MDAKKHLLGNLWERFHFLSAKGELTRKWMEEFVRFVAYGDPREAGLVNENFTEIGEDQFEWGVRFHNLIQEKMGRKVVPFERVASWIGYTGIEKREPIFTEISDKIPRIIHQMWIGDSPMPAHCSEWVDEMIAMNPSIEHRFHGNELFLRYGDDPLICKQRQMGAKWCYMADRFRLLLLRDEGGMYIDVDVMPLLALESLFIEFESSDFVCAHRTVGSKLSHPDIDVMMAKKGSRVVADLLTVEQSIHTGKLLLEAIMLNSGVTWAPSHYWYGHHGEGFLQSEGNHLLTWQTKFAA